VSSALGAAEVSLQDVAADRNTAGSIYVNAMGQTGASVGFADVSAQDNAGVGAYGINAVALVTGSGDGRLTMDNVGAGGNTGVGAFGINGVVTVVGSGDGLLTMNNVDAGGNTGVGAFGVNASVSTPVGSVTMALSDVEAGGNVGVGAFRINVVESTLGGAAWLTMVDIGAGGNTGVGAFALAADVSVTGGDVWIDLVGIEANNSYDGVGISVSAVGGSADIQVREALASGNGGNGIRVGATASDDVTASFEDCQADNNASGSGIAATLISGAGDVEAKFKRNHVSGNTTNGITVVATTLGSVRVGARENQVYGNTINGFSINATAGGTYDLVLGQTALPGGSGWNSIYGNGAFGVNNAGGGVVQIENNFWGGGTPVGGAAPVADYRTPGVAAPATFLATDPNL
jgi:hypothetical protein